MSMDIKDLKELRVQLGITLTEASKWLKVAAGTISYWELEKYKPTSDSLFNYEQFIQDVIDGKIKVKTSHLAGNKVGSIKMPMIADIFPKNAITPKYYKAKSGIQAIDYIEAFNLNFNLGNVIKYVTRAGKKTDNAFEDLQKARWYLNREIERIDNNEEIK